MHIPTISPPAQELPDPMTTLPGSVVSSNAVSVFHEVSYTDKSWSGTVYLTGKPSEAMQKRMDGRRELFIKESEWRHNTQPLTSRRPVSHISSKSSSSLDLTVSAVSLALRTHKLRTMHQSQGRERQNNVVKIGDQPQSIDFRYQDGSRVDLVAFLPPYSPSLLDGPSRGDILDDKGNCKVIASQLHAYGGLKGSASFTGSQGSLPDIGFDPGEIVFPTKILQHVARWPGLPEILATKMSSMAFDRPEISFMAICKEIGRVSDSDVSPQEKMIFMQQLVSELLHRTRFGALRGGAYGSVPWEDKEGPLQQAAKRDIERVAVSGRKADISPFQDSFKLSDFVANGFGDCRPTNLLMTFALQAAGFGGKDDIQIVNVRCARVEKLEDIQKIDDLQKEGGAVLRQIELVNNEIAANNVMGRDNSKENAELENLNHRFFAWGKKPEEKGIKAQLAELAGDHTLIVMKWPPHEAPENQTLRFADFFYGEMHGLPVSAASQPLSEAQRDELRKGFFDNYKIRSFFSEKVRDSSAAPNAMHHKAPYAQIRAFLPYPEVVGSAHEPVREKSTLSPQWQTVLHRIRRNQI